MNSCIDRSLVIFALCIFAVPSIASNLESVVRAVTTETKNGPIKGVVTTIPGRSDTVLQYRKVPFAKPPIGKLRFSKPEPYGAWGSELDATEFGPSCMQGATQYFHDKPNEDYSEDCLFLNIYAPSTPKDEKRPVMVWIHGGGFTVGQGMFYNASYMANTGDVVVVTINYRLGIFGFYSLNDPKVLGNYGLWDQIEALRWINENIESFGGDKDSVTIFGESAGGFSVSLLSLIPSNRGLFHRVIAQSGTSMSPYANSPACAFASQAVTAYIGCHSDDLDARLSCMREKSAEDLLQASSPKNFVFVKSDELHLILGMGPVVDGELFPDVPQNLLSNSYPDIVDFYKSLDVIAGTTSQEGSLLYILLAPPELQEKHNFKLYEGIPTEVFQKLIVGTLVGTYYQNNTGVWQAIASRYTDTSSMEAQSMRSVELYAVVFFVVPTIQSLIAHASENHQGKTYQYNMARVSPLPFGPPVPSWFKGCGHADDLLYLFGMEIKKLQGFSISDEDITLATQMMKYWTNFARTGNPNLPKSEDLPVWPQFDGQSRLYMELDSPVQAKHGLVSEDVKFWTETVPTLLKSENHSHNTDREEL
ncbi:hypothetical protein FSP39_006307 [Pinctada imbricata]|uniref:Carboxylic ester hydrolase n=1 Tax=Pinctada imbricata TaxID=66713 RepID=A0AA88YMQ8_PINIB|nr:hypothetical protein FSP39_006307 [Pinctada imbricata]